MVKRKLRRSRTKIERLQIQEAKLRRELNGTLKEISEDTRKRGSEGSLRAHERQKLANRSIDIRSKLIRLQDEIGTRSYIKEDKDSRDVRRQIEEKYSTAARKHNKLLRMTIEMEHLKKDEDAIRYLAADGLGRQIRKNEASESNKEVEQRKLPSTTSRISTTSLRHSTRELDMLMIEREKHLDEVRESLSTLGFHKPEDQLEEADRLKHKYELTRDMRNLTHGQMISRSNRNSYWRINPPYRRERQNLSHVRRSYTRDFYEDKIDIRQAKERNLATPRKEFLKKIREKEEQEMGRFTMLSGRTISIKKMKGFTPPGMTLSQFENDIQHST